MNFWNKIFRRQAATALPKAIVQPPRYVYDPVAQQPLSREDEAPYLLKIGNEYRLDLHRASIHLSSGTPSAAALMVIYGKFQASKFSQYYSAEEQHQFSNKLALVVENMRAHGMVSPVAARKMQEALNTPVAGAIKEAQPKSFKLSLGQRLRNAWTAFGNRTAPQPSH